MLPLALRRRVSSPEGLPEMIGDPSLYQYSPGGGLRALQGVDLGASLVSVDALKL